MAITIDDGTFAVGNSFVTAREAEAFHEARGYTDWTTSTDDAGKEAALIRAFDFLSVQNWKTDTFETSVPTKVEQAQILGALKELSSPGSLQPDITTGIKSQSIEGAVETEYYSTGEGTLFTVVENLIRPYINQPGIRTSITR